jgi:hypothetical protein
MTKSRRGRSRRVNVANRRMKRNPDLAKALEKHKAENPEIVFAIDAMRRSQLVQAEKVRHLFSRVSLTNNL